MSKEALDELLDFLKSEIRFHLKHIALSNLVGLTGDEEGIRTMLKNDQIIQRIIELTDDDRNDEIARLALLILVNISAHDFGAAELLKYRPRGKNIIELLVGYVLDPLKVHADPCCIILSNITRLEDELELCLNTLMPHLDDVLNVFVNTEFNKKRANLDYLSTMFSNLSRSYRVRQWFMQENTHTLAKLLPFCDYQMSTIRRSGTIGTVRNLSFDTKCHEFLLKDDLYLLTYILQPLMGNEDYEDDEMDKLPLLLQYLPKEKTREPDVDIRIMLLETLNKLCATRHGRETLRGNGVYYILREYHKWEKDQKALLACENVVDILIQNEDEVGAEDLSSVDIPDDLQDKFQKMDESYLNA